MNMRHSDQGIPKSGDEGILQYLPRPKIDADAGYITISRTAVIGTGVIALVFGTPAFILLKPTIDDVVQAWNAKDKVAPAPANPGETAAPSPTSDTVTPGHGMAACNKVETQPLSGEGRVELKFKVGDTAVTATIENYWFGPTFKNVTPGTTSEYDINKDELVDGVPHNNAQAAAWVTEATGQANVQVFRLRNGTDLAAIQVCPPGTRQ